MSVLAELMQIERRHFFSTTWPEQHGVSHGALERIPWITDLGELTSIENYVEHVAQSEVPVLLYPADRCDESAARAVQGWQLRAEAEQRSMFSVCPAEALSPSLLPRLLQLRAELGLSALSNSRCIVYGSYGGPAAAWHWDAGVNFIVQLAGSKRWSIAPNDLIPNPPDRYSTVMPLWPSRLAHHVSQDPPTSGPASWETIELHPGSVLFLPSGYWHTTASDDESLALNLTYGTPDRAQVLCRYISRVFRSDARWRRLAQPSPLSPDCADAEFDLLLGELIEHLGRRSSSDLFRGLVEFDAQTTPDVSPPSDSTNIP